MPCTLAPKNYVVKFHCNDTIGHILTHNMLESVEALLQTELVELHYHHHFICP